MTVGHWKNGCAPQESPSLQNPDVEERWRLSVAVLPFCVSLALPGGDLAWTQEEPPVSSRYPSVQTVHWQSAWQVTLLGLHGPRILFLVRLLCVEGMASFSGGALAVTYQFSVLLFGSSVCFVRLRTCSVPQRSLSFSPCSAKQWCPRITRRCLWELPPSMGGAQQVVLSSGTFLCAGYHCDQQRSELNTVSGSSRGTKSCRPMLLTLCLLVNSSCACVNVHRLSSLSVCVVPLIVSITTDMQICEAPRL